MLELEGLAMGVFGKRNLWETMEALDTSHDLSGFEFEELIDRADVQLSSLRRLHRLAAEQTFGEAAAEGAEGAPL